MRLFIKAILFLSASGLLGLAAVYLINLRVDSYSKGKIFGSAEGIADNDRVAIILGAKVWNDGSLSHVLLDRVTTGVELYRAGKVKKLLMSGDNPTTEYDEPTAMKRYAMELGVPEEDIVLDFGGRRTYDTCYRAREIFEVKKVVMVSQEFHLYRAIYLCQNMGIDAVGVTSNRRKYLGENYWTFREFFSVFSAWFEMNFVPFAPITGKKEPIQLD